LEDLIKQNKRTPEIDTISESELLTKRAMTNLYLTKAAFLLLLIFDFGVCEAQTGQWADIKGAVTDASTQEKLPGVTIIIDGTSTGTISDGQGRFGIRVPQGKWLLRFSFVGYKTIVQEADVSSLDSIELEVELTEVPLEMDAVEVTSDAIGDDLSAEIIRPEILQWVPAPIQDGFRILKTMPGVVTNNELSSEYSVRGGGFNENQVLINGFEVYRPIRSRQGEQEGLGILNPDMIETMTFYTGGFPARYGGKLSSALDVEYKFPDSNTPHGSATISMFDASLTVGAGSKQKGLSGNIGLRTSRPSLFFNTQDIKGAYDPLFLDIQSNLKWQISDRHEIHFLGTNAQHRFNLSPYTRRTNFWDDVVGGQYLTSEYDGYRSSSSGRYGLKFSI